MADSKNFHKPPLQQQNSADSLLNVRVYRETTLPLTDPKRTKYKKNPNRFSSSKANVPRPSVGEVTPTATPDTVTNVKKKRRDKSDLGENFIAPDGGWAWLVCIAAGMSNLSIYPCLQQFGFIFRERMHTLGMSSSQITTIINTNPAISACTGLLNGPMFRRFTFRQVAMAGSLLVFLGITLTAFCETFLGYMVAYALLFGFGMGISVSASSLAINTYFKNKRRKACGFSWTITGLGPIFLPFVVTILVAYYGVQGTVLIFAAFSLHSFVSALIYQPVQYHTKPIPEDQDPEEPEFLCAYCTLQQRREKGIFSSQYLYQEDDEDKPGYEIIEPGTPMLSRANDGWYGSKLNLSSIRPRLRTVSSYKDLELSPRFNRMISEQQKDKEEEEEFLKPNNFRRERDDLLRRSPSKGTGKPLLLRGDSINQNRCTCAEERTLLELTKKKNSEANNNTKKDEEKQNVDVDSKISENLSFFQKFVTFFDLDLLRDFTYVNLVVGLTIINFGELNFSILTPFILDDFGLTTSQITTAMAVLGSMDITMRFLVPFLTEKIPWDNRFFFLIGVVGIALGRTVVACTRSFPVILCCFVWMGIFKGVRTIFWPLVIPSYVPLNRLPAASGLQLLISGLFTLAAGPFVGLVRDHFDYAFTLHCLNMMSFIAAISWTLETLIRRHRRKRKLAT